MRGGGAACSEKSKWTINAANLDMIHSFKNKRVAVKYFYLRRHTTQLLAKVLRWMNLTRKYFELVRMFLWMFVIIASLCILCVYFCPCIWIFFPISLFCIADYPSIKMHLTCKKCLFGRLRPPGHHCPWLSCLVNWPVRDIAYIVRHPCNCNTLQPSFFGVHPSN